MRYQTTEYTCGPTALQNALRCFGVKLGIDELVRLCGTTPDGTDENGIKSAISGLGYRFIECSTNERTEAREWLRVCFEEGLVVIACTNHHEHWVCICRGPLCDRVLLIDSDRTRANLAENGVHSITIEKALNRIRAAKRHGIRYYMIGLIGEEVLNDL